MATAPPLDSLTWAGEMSYIAECSVCIEEFNDPRILPCGHSFCSRCLVQLVQHGHIVCPNCRTCTDVTSGIDCLPRNFDLVGVVDRVRAERIIRREKESKFAPCPDHPERLLEIYCQRCQHMICADCVRRDHDGHQTGDIERAFIRNERTEPVQTKMSTPHQWLEKVQNKSFDEQQLQAAPPTFDQVLQSLQTKALQVTSAFRSKGYLEETTDFADPVAVLSCDYATVTKILLDVLQTLELQEICNRRGWQIKHDVIKQVLQCLEQCEKQKEDQMRQIKERQDHVQALKLQQQFWRQTTIVTQPLRSTKYDQYKNTYTNNMVQTTHVPAYATGQQDMSTKTSRYNGRGNCRENDHPADHCRRKPARFVRGPDDMFVKQPLRGNREETKPLIHSESDTGCSCIESICPCFSKSGTSV